MSLPVISLLLLLWSIVGMVAAIKTAGRHPALLYGPLYWVFCALWAWCNRERHYE